MYILLSLCKFMMSLLLMHEDFVILFLPMGDGSAPIMIRAYRNDAIKVKISSTKCYRDGHISTGYTQSFRIDNFISFWIRIKSVSSAVARRRIIM
jgi:hypothetical protein